MTMRADLGLVVARLGHCRERLLTEGEVDAARLLARSMVLVRRARNGLVEESSSAAKSVEHADPPSQPDVGEDWLPQTPASPKKARRAQRKARGRRDRR